MRVGKAAIAAAISVAACLAATLGATGTALAQPAGLSTFMEQNHNGEAGYYVNDSGGWRIRDVHSTVTVTAAMQDINGTANGAVGEELCNPNDGAAAQLGVVWTGSGYQVRFNTGMLATSGTDPCVEGGLLTVGYSTLLDAITINAGDVLTFDLYYSPATHWLKFTAADVTQDITRQSSQYEGYQNFYEAGIGVLSNCTRLTPPAVNVVAQFSGASFNNYGASSGSHSVLGGWETRQAEAINGGSQVIVSPNSSLNVLGNAFTVSEGGII